MFDTHEGQEFAAYSLDVEGTAGWVLRNQFSDVLYTGTVHKIKNYENASVSKFYFIIIC